MVASPPDGSGRDLALPRARQEQDRIRGGSSTSSSRDASSLAASCPSVGSSTTVTTAPTTASPPPGYRYYLRLLVWFLVDQHFIIGLGLVVLIASQVQVPPSGQHAREVVVTYLGVSIIFFVTGCTLPTRVLLENYSRWRLHLFVQVQCFLLTSATVFGVVSAAATNRDFLDPGIIIGFIFLGCLPTTLASNVVMTGQAHGNTALTVVQTTIGSFLGPLLTPLLITMYTSTGAWYDSFLPANNGGYAELYRRVFKQLGLSVYVPMVAGQLVQNLFPGPTRKVLVQWQGKRINSIALLVVIWQTFDQAFATGAFEGLKPSNVVFLVFMSLAFWVVWLATSFWTSLPWLSKRDTIAVCYCVPGKTPAMGVPLSNVMYVGLSALQASKLQIPIVIFQGLQIVCSSLLTIVFRRWIRPEEERIAAEEKEKRAEVAEAAEVAA
jgi:sodium/bile acid cotransporter 7